MFNKRIFDNKIKDANTALQLMKNYLLVSKTYGSNSCIYALSKDKILVINNTRKYYISFDEFRTDFYLSDFYIYKKNPQNKRFTDIFSMQTITKDEHFDFYTRCAYNVRFNVGVSEW